MAEMDIVPYIGTRTPADFDTLFDELEAARGSSASLSDAIAEKAGKATTLSGYGITDAYTKTETDTVLSGKQDELSQSQLAAANSGITAEKLTADEAALVEVVDNGAKNLLKFGSLSQLNRNGVDYTLNSDGSVTVNGTPSGTAPSYVTLMIDETTMYDAAEFCDGKHIISGCPSGGGPSSYRIQVAKSIYAVYDYGNGAILSPTTLTGVGVLIYIPNGVTVNNLVFRPMICTKAAWDVSHKIVPYCPPMAEMYAMILALQNGTRSAPALTLAKAEPEETEPETGEEETR